ncbi:hypothetical protein SERLADRAFT_439527 [Serpula lacrymans var. lacrymans S7.9]|uniref:Endopeptidase S2P n=1 Tax=Serpula lacrymans var. lacrymans (strain S7.9) TaxID=578457 RepID=F8P0T0_SERL9|nr:uncharacterized protein SERLADRAFT_439527 [Serpula lacrymans var. lacrymans S7.9]EGO22764.1 hypothetical protein SERLADRAFT_439527 [Serpula lacrymans var. lacrymans S7.9]
MSLLTAFILLSVAAYIIRSLSKWLHRQPTLPFHTSESSSTTLTFQPRNLHLRVQTSLLNPFHDYLSALFSTKQHSRLASVLDGFYTLGSILGVLGMVAALGLLLWNTALLAGATFSHFHRYYYDNTRPSGIVKRHADGGTDVADGSYDSAFALRPIIPGLTAPFSELPFIFLSLLIGQFVHEAGHFVSSALHSIPLLSAGFSLVLVLPSAHLSLASTPLSSLHPKQKLHIISAGCFHNLLAYLLLLSLSRAGLSTLWSYVGYEDVSAWGRVIVHVDEDSPLRAHLPIGSVITYLDDVPLNATDSSGTDPWDTYLLRSLGSSYPNSPAQLGWCVDAAWYQAQNTSSSLSCFTSVDFLNEHCIDPVPLLTHPFSTPKSPTHQFHSNTQRRCTANSACFSTETCIQPHLLSHLLRITVQSSYRHDEGERSPSASALPAFPSDMSSNGALGGLDDDGKFSLPSSIPSTDEHVILWSGPRAEVYDQVEVSNLLPSYPFLPSYLPNVIATFSSYLQLTMLSLYLLNLLPLPFLDGSQLLSVLLHLISTSSQTSPADIDLEALDSRADDRRRNLQSQRWGMADSGPSVRVRDMGTAAAGTTTMVLMGACGALGLLNWLLAG